MDPFPGSLTTGDSGTYGSSGGLHWFDQTTGSHDQYARLYGNSNDGLENRMD
ncbi:MAG: hypothetical protein R2766_02640 [Saprospiraceae bacterium]